MNHFNFECKGSATMRTVENGLWFTAASSPPNDFRHKNAVFHSYLETQKRYRLPLRIDMKVTLDAPGFYVLLGNTGRINVCSIWDDNRRIGDIADSPTNGKPIFFANQIPLKTPTEITIIYNLQSMQILINGEQRYYSKNERYMKSKLFPNLNAAGFPLRLTCYKRTEVIIHAFTVAESERDFEITEQESMPDPIMCNIMLPSGVKPSYENIIAALGEKPSFDACIANLPDEIRLKVIETDHFLRSYKPIQFRRTIEKNGNKITYLASDAGVSYMINLSRDMLRHTFEWYMLFNSKENWGKRKADNLIATLEKLSADDAAFADSIFSYLKDCTGCYGAGCMAKSTYAYKGKTKHTCHGKIEFKMTTNEFDDVLRLIHAI